LVYGTFSPWAVDLTRLQTEYVDGELLKAIRVGQSNSIPQIAYDLGTGVYGFGENQLGPIDAHSMATLVILKYAQGASTDWNASAKYFWPLMYKDTFAQSIGTGSIQGGLRDKNDYSGILRQIIAYSAIDEGTNDTNARPFGDTAIRALYNDANDLGKALSISGTVSSNLTNYADEISKTFVQYAGQLALNKILQLNHSDVLDGVLDLKTAAGGSYLSVDLSSSTWSVGTGPTITPAYSLISGGVFKEYLNVNVLRAQMQLLWGDNTPNIFDKALFKATDGGNISFADIPVTDATKSTLIVGANGVQSVTGTNGNDLIIGGSGNDTMFGGDGNDIFIGGGGLMYGSAANDNGNAIKPRVVLMVA